MSTSFFLLVGVEVVLLVVVHIRIKQNERLLRRFAGATSISRWRCRSLLRSGSTRRTRRLVGGTSGFGRSGTAVPRPNPLHHLVITLTEFASTDTSIPGDTPMSNIHQSTEQAADAIIALINSRVQSPTKAELVGILAKASSPTVLTTPDTASRLSELRAVIQEVEAAVGQR